MGVSVSVRLLEDTKSTQQAHEPSEERSIGLYFDCKFVKEDASMLRYALRNTDIDQKA